MSARRKTVIILIALLAMGALLLTTLRAVHHESSARQKLENLLGDHDAVPFEESAPGSDQPGNPNAAAPDESPLPNAEQPGLPSGFPQNFAQAFGFGMPDTSVKVQETSRAYELYVPLADPGDASSVKLNVTSRRIEIAGQTGSRHGAASVTSSFMQSFTTSQEVLPGSVSRATRKHGEQTELVITIPKKHPGATSPATPNPEPTPPETPPNLNPEPDENPGVSPPGQLQEDPFQGQHHQVI